MATRGRVLTAAELLNSLIEEAARGAGIDGQSFVDLGVTMLETKERLDAQELRNLIYQLAGDNFLDEDSIARLAEKFYAGWYRRQIKTLEGEVQEWLEQNAEGTVVNEGGNLYYELEELVLMRSEELAANQFDRYLEQGVFLAAENTAEVFYHYEELHDEFPTNMMAVAAACERYAADQIRHYTDLDTLVEAHNDNIEDEDWLDDEEDEEDY